MIAAAHFYYGGRVMGILPEFIEPTKNRLPVDAVISGYGEDTGYAFMNLYDQSGLLDAFGRLRVSNPYTIFSSKQVYKDSALANNVENYPHLYDNQQTSGAGTSTLFNINTASTTLSVSNVTAGTRVRQSRRRMNYQPGKAQRMLFTGLIGHGTTGIRKRYGLFDNNNGLFFEEDDGELYVVQRSFATGVALDTRVHQSNWNIDSLDGLGISGVTLDLDKTNIFYIHFEWLGVGPTRFGIVVNGAIYYCHQFNNSNSLTTTYMSTPNLPVRTEITNKGTGPAASIITMCASIDSEGGVQPSGRDRAVDNLTTPITLPLAGTEYAMLGIRLRSSHAGIQIDPTFIDTVITSQADTARFRLHINPVVSGTFTWSDYSDTSVQVARSGATPPTISTPGYIIASGYIKTDKYAEIPERLNEKIGSNIAGITDTLVLAITPLSVSVDILCTLNWRELA